MNISVRLNSVFYMYIDGEYALTLSNRIQGSDIVKSGNYDMLPANKIIKKNHPILVQLFSDQS